MRNEKQSDIKKRLDGLDNLPGEQALNKNAAWENLHIRLYPDPKSKKTGWYWIAACLLLLPLPFIFNKPNTAPLTEKRLQQKQKTPPVLPITINKKETAAAVFPVVAKKTYTKRTAVRDRNRLEKKNAAAGLYDPVTINLAAPRTPSPELINPVLSTSDTPIAVTAAAPVKKKLLVVHINELGNQEQGEQKFALHNHRPYFQIKLINTERYSNASLSASRTGLDMLRTKIPLKN